MRKAAPETIVNDLRKEVLTHVRGGESPGIFAHGPDRGGKTFASPAFALDHSRRHGLDRIVYGIRFTSVIDQTATIFRSILGGDIVLEHHSAIDEERAAAKLAISRGLPWRIGRHRSW